MRNEIGPYPVIITNHGYIDTRYYTNGRGLRREQNYLAKRGYIVLHPDWRNHNGSDSDPDNAFKLNMGYTEDVINGVYAIKNSNFEFIDKNNIGLLGHSLGGGIALNIMVTKPGLIKSYVLFAPISIDMRDNYYRWIANMSPTILKKYGPPPVREKIIKKYGTPDSNPEFWNDLSPKNFIQNIKDPVIVHQGLADEEVPYKWAYKLRDVFSQDRKNIKLYTYPGEHHEFSFAWLKVMEISTRFFDSSLKH
ncbi:MAG: alpha/beta fold hydrolase [Candidatus Saganbacteria bacterium]|nr:alpha/beta fold hydrolase [Candidatus Saganbacteria bacterium]